MEEGNQTTYLNEQPRSLRYG